MKNVRVLTTLLFLFFASGINAQDLITLKTGEEMEAKVLEINDQEIKYKKSSNMDGPTYSIKKSEIFMIKYENGDKEVFKQVEELSEKGSTQPENSGPVSANRQLSLKAKTFGIKYYEGDASISKQEILGKLKGNTARYELFKKGGTLNTVGNIIGVPAGFVFGWNLGTLAGGGDANSDALTLSGIGVVGSLVLNFVGRKNMKTALDSYNNNTTVQLEFKTTKNGTGLCLTF